MKYLERTIGDKKIIWFSDSNKYFLLELPAFEVIKKVLEGETAKQIVKWCSLTYQIPKGESERFVSELSSLFEKQAGLQGNDTMISPTCEDKIHPSGFYSKKVYKIHAKHFEVNYQTAQLEYHIHPRFAHLETDNTQVVDHVFSIYMTKNMYTLEIDSDLIGFWVNENIHYFTGKFSMELLNRLYNKTELDWIGVFHASAIKYNNQSALFLGDSGSGKSTLAAILMSEGLQLVADDFVPLDKTENLNNFPAAVSIKHSAIDALKHLFPRLENAKEYYFPALKKTVRYLVPDLKDENQSGQSRCKALVFVKYVKDSGLIIEKLPAEIAFQHLIPDSWLSPEIENATRFLDWFLLLPSYQLTYSDNKKMVATVKQLFSNE